MSFDVDGDAYGRFMGRFSEPLAARFFELLEVREEQDPREGQRALDVGCGPGALTAPLVDRLGVASVSAVDPSEPFVDAVRERFPGIDAHVGIAEKLPYPDDGFDFTVAQLVVHFMSDPVRGVAEMARVTRPGGVVAACVWDFGGDRDPLAIFWRAVRSLDASAADESNRPGTRDGDLLRIFRDAGFPDAEPVVLTVHIEFATFEEWWDPFTLGVGPAGAYLASLDAAGQKRVEARCAELLPSGPFAIDASAWTVVGRVSSLR